MISFRIWALLFMLWADMDMGRTHKSNPDIREAFSFLEDELFSLVTQLLLNRFKSFLAMRSSQNIKGQNETGYPFYSITSDLYSKPKQLDIKQIQQRLLGEVYDELSKSSWEENGINSGQVEKNQHFSYTLVNYTHPQWHVNW